MACNLLYVFALLFILVDAIGLLYHSDDSSAFISYVSYFSIYRIPTIIAVELQVKIGSYSFVFLHNLFGVRFE